MNGKRIHYHCARCDGQDVRLDAEVRWNAVRQAWDVLSDWREDDAWCMNCEDDTEVVVKEGKDPRIAPGQIWVDDNGIEARVVFVAEGYVMLRRGNNNPFLNSKEMFTLPSKRIWTLVSDPDAEERLKDQ